MMTLNELYNELLCRYGFLKKFYTLEITQDVNCIIFSFSFTHYDYEYNYLYKIRVLNNTIFCFEYLRFYKDYGKDYTFIGSFNKKDLFRNLDIALEYKARKKELRLFEKGINRIIRQSIKRIKRLF